MMRNRGNKNLPLMQRILESAAVVVAAILVNRPPKVPPTSATGKALNYLNNEWLKLVRYLEDRPLEIDNNAAEHAIRPFVAGRKNCLFSDSVKSVNASANLYSLIETAKANGLEPYA